MNDYESMIYKRVMEMQNELKHIKEDICGNINERLIKVEGKADMIDLRTAIYVPKRLK